MKTIRLLWDNRAFDSATLKASSAAAGYPVTCLQDRLRTRKWRSIGLTSQFIDIDFGSAHLMNAWTLVDHNLSMTGTITITASNTVIGGSDLFNRTYDAWQDISGYGEGGYGMMGYGGMVPEAERPWLVPRPIRIIYPEYYGGWGFSGWSESPGWGEEDLSLISPPEEVRYLRITFTDAANPDGYIELGRLFAVMFADFGRDFSEITHGSIDDTDVRISQGGQSWANPLPQRETITLTFGAINYADKYWMLKHMIRKMGVTGTFILDCFPYEDGADKPSQRHFSTLLCRFPELPELTETADAGIENGMRVSTTDLTFEEAL